MMLRPCIAFLKHGQKLITEALFTLKNIQGLFIVLQKIIVLCAQTVCAEPKSDREWLIARDLSGYKKGNSVLIIGDLAEGEKATPLTLSVAITANGKGSQRAGSVDCTHPDAATANRLHADIAGFYMSKEVPIDPGTFNFYEDLPLAFEVTDHTYVTLGMGKYPKADKFIAECWRDRQRRDNTIAHLQKGSGARALSSAWNFGSMEGYISPEAIKKESWARRSAYQEMVVAVQEATILCARMREHNTRPTGQVIQKKNFPLMLEIV